MSKAKAEVSLYHLTTHPMEKILPRILEKVYDGGMRALVITDTTDHMQALNSTLWTYSSGAFLPHGMDGIKMLDPKDNPIWISIEATNKNDATVLVLTNGRQVDDLVTYTRCVDIFDGNDPAALACADQRRNQYQQNGHAIVYWKQSMNGNWDQVPVS